MRRATVVFQYMLIVCLALGTVPFQAAPQARDLATVEEQRIPAALTAMPAELKLLHAQADDLKQRWQQARDMDLLRQQVLFGGDQLWQSAKHLVKSAHPSKGGYDDRSLYWTRLQLTRYMREQTFLFSVSATERNVLIELLEQSSRGHLDLAYRKNTKKRILITGFDPFLLDRNISQSNPSGVLALLLDGQQIEYGGITAEINALMFPVRYADFDAGEVESALAPFYALNSVDLVITISMGREDFDLEHFPGRRRSATAPDNLSILAGGSETQPVIPELYRGELQGPEFVQFSLPVAAMQKAKGPYAINDRRVVTTLEKTFEADNLEQLRWATAVRGGGGGYLSNEISYRSIRLRNKLGSTIPTGHIHTPRMPDYDRAMLVNIVDQVTGMLKLALAKI